MNGTATRGLSIVLSGGYMDDEDLADVIIYTGEAGRDSAYRAADRGSAIDCGKFGAGRESFARHSNSRPSWRTSRYRFARGISIPLRWGCIASLHTGRKLEETGSRFGVFA
jgi:hypothetical protein